MPGIFSTMALSAVCKKQQKSEWNEAVSLMTEESSALSWDSFQCRNLPACRKRPAFGERSEAGKKLKPHPLIRLFCTQFRLFPGCLSHISLSCYRWCRAYAQEHMEHMANKRITLALTRRDVTPHRVCVGVGVLGRHALVWNDINMPHAAGSSTALLGKCGKDEKKGRKISTPPCCEDQHEIQHVGEGKS